MEIDMINCNDDISISNSSFKDNSIDEISNYEKLKRKRRSKNDQDGRMFKCECGRAYLSALALSNHKKSKHMIEKLELKYSNEDSRIDFDGKKKRGRPKKNCEFKLSNFPEIHYNLFFENELRKKGKGDTINIKNFVSSIFDEIYVNLQPKYVNDFKSHEEHPLLLMIHRDYINSHPHTCDQIFLKYLRELSNATNDEYFYFVFKFIILFRDCINKYKNIELENSILILNEKIPKEIKEFTQFYDAEQVPEICNEFLTEFLEYHDYFGIKEDFIAEFIPIIQHFCYWLFHNNFTSSRLSLVTS